MLLAVPHSYGDNWVFYVIAPLIFAGIMAGLWMIIKGASGLFH
jgi:hypothetical protein